MFDGIFGDDFVDMVSGRITQAELKELFYYDPETGNLINRISRNYNAQKNTIAGTLNAEGYRVIHIRKRIYFAHVLVWVYITGTYPPNELDHKNRNRSDNRIENLRKATRSQNKANTNFPKPTKSGFVGVVLNGRKWAAKIKVDQKRIYLGTFDTPEEAHFVYLNAREQHFGNFNPEIFREKLNQMKPIEGLELV